MSISDLLKNKSSNEKNDIKIKELIKSNIRKFSRKGFDIEILELGQEDDRLKVVVRLMKNNKEIFVDNPLYFLNPPIMIPDGTDNLKEDIDEALQEMIADCLRITIDN